MPVPKAPVTPASRVVPSTIRAPEKPALLLVRSSVPPTVPLPIVRLWAPVRALLMVSVPEVTTMLESAVIEKAEL